MFSQRVGSENYFVWRSVSRVPDCPSAVAVAESETGSVPRWLARQTALPDSVRLPGILSGNRIRGVVLQVLKRDPKKLAWKSLLEGGNPQRYTGN